MKYVVNKEKQSMLCTCLCESGLAGSREKPGHCLFLSLYSPPLHLFVLYMTSTGICQELFSLKVSILRWYLCFGTCDSGSHLHCSNHNVPNTVPVLRGWDGGQRPYAETSGTRTGWFAFHCDGREALGQRSDFHCSMVSCSCTSASGFSELTLYVPLYNYPLGTDSALHLSLLNTLVIWKKR